MKSYLWIREFLVGKKKEMFENLLKAEAEKEYMWAFLDKRLCPECGEPVLREELELDKRGFLPVPSFQYTCSRCDFEYKY